MPTTTRPRAHPEDAGDSLVCLATQRNWDRLAVTDLDSRLRKRANKLLSTRQFVPSEYLSNVRNTQFVSTFVDEFSRSGYKVADIMYSLVMNCFGHAGLVGGASSSKPNAARFLQKYSNLTAIDSVVSMDLPTDERDLLGLLYQSLHSEGARSRRGLYYTPPELAARLTADLDFSLGQSLLDPCCGSGAFLLSAPVSNPDQLLGVDNDPVAVMLCGANLIMKFREEEFDPQVYCFDFLSLPNLLEPPDITATRARAFDYVCTNPPWGARQAEGRSLTAPSETFDAFLRVGVERLSDSGVLKYLLPESFINVAAFRELRSFLLENYSITQIESLGNLFTGVTTKVVALSLARGVPSGPIVMVSGSKRQTVDTATLLKSANATLTHVSPDDERILEAVSSEGFSDLSQSTWALGIVTGDNARHLHATEVPGSEPIFTGKDVQPYRMLQPQKHLVYDRASLQQVAKESIYRASEKLVYKFISSRLVFAYDNTGTLCLNSANILIPRVRSMSIRSVLLFLNSELFQFVYLKRFGEIKILKRALCELPFPMISERLDAKFTRIADKLINGHTESSEEAQDAVYEFYGLSSSKVAHVKEVVGRGASTR